MLTPYRLLPHQVYVLCLGSFLNRAGSFVLVFLTIYASERLGFGIPFASACMGVVGLGSMAGALLGGQTLGAVLIAAGFGMNVLELGITYSIVTIMIWTIGEILQAPFKQAIVTEIAPAHLRARYFGVMSLCFGFSITIGAPLGGLILDVHGAGPLWVVMIGISATAIMAYHLAGNEIRAAKTART